MKFIYTFISLLLIIFFSIDYNLFGIKDKAYKKYPNLVLGKKLFNEKSILNHLNNDHNVKFLPDTQFTKINFEKVKLSFEKEVQSKDSKKIYSKEEARRVFFIELIENNIWIIDFFGNFYLTNIKELNKAKNEKEILSLKNINSNFPNKSVLGSLVYKNNIYIYSSERKHDCWYMSVHVAKIDSQNLNFKNFFKSDECAKNYIEIGRMQVYVHKGTKGILITSSTHPAGDFSNYTDKNPQDDNSIFGKILFIDLNEKKSIVFSKGHRVAQGLYVENDLIISTEHGPKGGDEINKILFNKNYGWPISSYGEKYVGGYTERPYYLKDHKSHGFQEPIFVFAKSIAISEIIKLPNNFSDHFINNFIISSLNGFSLYRVKFDEKYTKVLFFEEIFIGQRIRDIKYHNIAKTILLTLENEGEIGLLYR